MKEYPKRLVGESLKNYLIRNNKIIKEKYPNGLSKKDIDSLYKYNK